MVDDFYDASSLFDASGPSAHDPHVRAFAAYEDAWQIRDNTADPTTRPLIESLRARQVPTSMWAEGTPLHRALFDSWERGRRPGRMHGTILRYRLSRVKAGVRDFRSFFQDDPEHLRIPEDYRRASRWSGGGDDEVELDFVPAVTLQTRLPDWYAELRDPYEDDDQEAIANVWLDVTSSSKPDRAPVMLGTVLIGHTSIPGDVHRRLIDAQTKKGRRVVADGTIDIGPDPSGILRATGLAISLPTAPK